MPDKYTILPEAKKQNILLAYVSMLRLKNLLIMLFMQCFVTIFLIGPKVQWLSVIVDSKVWLVILATVLSAGAGYVINDYHDVKIDAVNKPLRIVVDRLVSRQHTLIFYFLLNTVALFCAYFASLRILLYVVVSQIILWAYSTYFKKSFFIGNFIVASMTMFAVLIIALYFQRAYYWVVIFAAFAFFMNLIREIIKDIEDLKGDRAFGAKTIPIVWGVRKTKKLLFVLIGLFLVFLFFLAFRERSGQLWILALMLSFVMAIFISYLKRADTSRAFGKLSKTCKFIMLAGILSIMLI